MYTLTAGWIIILLISAPLSYLGFLRNLLRPLRWKTSLVFGWMVALPLIQFIYWFVEAVQEYGFDMSKRKVEDAFYFSLAYIVLTATHFGCAIARRKTDPTPLLTANTCRWITKMALSLLLGAAALIPAWLYLIAASGESPSLHPEYFSGWRVKAGWSFLQVMLLVGYCWILSLVWEKDNQKAPA